ATTGVDPPRRGDRGHLARDQRRLAVSGAAGHFARHLLRGVDRHRRRRNLPGGGVVLRRPLELRALARRHAHHRRRDHAQARALGWFHNDCRLWRNDLGALPLPPNSGLPEFGALSWPKSDKSDFGWERGGVRGFGRSVSMVTPSPHPSPQMGRGSTPRAGRLRRTRHSSAPTIMMMVMPMTMVGPVIIGLMLVMMN